MDLNTDDTLFSLNTNNTNNTNNFFAHGSHRSHGFFSLRLIAIMESLEF